MQYSHDFVGFIAEETVFGFVDPKEAKIRKDVVLPLFSRSAIRKLEYLVQDKVIYYQHHN